MNPFGQGLQAQQQPHQQHFQQQQNKNSGQQICKSFQKGHCHYGNKCKFSHNVGGPGGGFNQSQNNQQRSPFAGGTGMGGLQQQQQQQLFVQHQQQPSANISPFARQMQQPQSGFPAQQPQSGFPAQQAVAGPQHGSPYAGLQSQTQAFQQNSQFQSQQQQQKVCPHFLKGTCKFGNKCRYSHNAQGQGNGGVHQQHHQGFMPPFAQGPGQGAFQQQQGYQGDEMGGIGMGERDGGLEGRQLPAPTLPTAVVEHTKAALDTLDIDAALGGGSRERALERVTGVGAAQGNDTENDKEQEQDNSKEQDESSPITYVEELADVPLGPAEQELIERPVSFFDVWGAVEKGAYSLEKQCVPSLPPPRRDRVF